MAKTIRIFKSFEEQEMYFLEYFARLTPSERLQAMIKLQKKNNIYTDTTPIKKNHYPKAFFLWTLKMKNSFCF